MSSQCAGCKQKLPRREYLACAYCKNFYDLECANVPVVRFNNTMTTAHKQSWKCPSCLCKTPKTGNSDNILACVNDIKNCEQYEKTTTQHMTPTNLTHRRKNITMMGNETISSEDISVLGDTISPKNPDKTAGKGMQEITLNTLSEMIVLKLQENNEKIVAQLQNTIHIEIREAVENLRKEFKQDMNLLKKENEKSKLEMEQLNTKIDKLTKEREYLQREMNNLALKVLSKKKEERVPESNCKKIVLYGFDEYYKEPEHSLYDRIHRVFHDLLHVDLTGYIEETYRIDCLHLQLYRDPKDRFKKGQTKASLSLQHFLGFESGFTLDKESNTIAIICQDVTVVLAFETRERLIAWQVKVGGQLGSSKEFLVMIGSGGSKKLPAGPARMHLQGRRFALTSGVPPRLLGLWELAHLRRYGVVDGRFCFEGGSHCGKGEGLHLLITDQAQDITDAFDVAAHGNLSLQRPSASRKGTDKGSKSRPNTRLSDFNTIDQSIPDTSSGLYEENFFGEDCGVSPYWPSDERRYDDHDFRSNDTDCPKPIWSGADHVTLERCNNCLTKLGAMSRSSTVAVTPGTNFNPAWTMEPVPESGSDNSSHSTEYLSPKAIKSTLEGCQCDKPPIRPPKPSHLDQKKPPAPLPASHNCTCPSNDNIYVNNPKVGPYENYDVPKTALVEVESSEHYDTPKRIKQALKDDLFQVTNSSTPGALVLKKNCGCILKFGSKKKTVIVECEESLQPVECPCQKVTNWANSLISLPYCKRPGNEVNTEILTNQKSNEMALYATVDVTRKTNRQSSSTMDKEQINTAPEQDYTNYQNIEPKSEKEFEGPYANYENLEFALSLEYYENAKDLLKKAGVTQTELDALSANIEKANNTLPLKPKLCTKCCHSQSTDKHQDGCKIKGDEYLLMEPANEGKRDPCIRSGPNPGYTPMSPNPNWSQSLKHPVHKMQRVDIEKSLSIPTLNGSGLRSSVLTLIGNNNKEAMQKRSSSVDSGKLLEDLKEFDSSIGSHATSSSLETLRNLALENRRSSSPCDNERECYDCCKSSGSDNKTSEENSSKEIPHLRNKHMDNAQIKRSSSVPCKSGGNRDSSSSNDSGVSSCSLKHGGAEYNEFEMPLTSGQSRYQYMMHRRMRGNLSGCLHSSLPRKSKSSDPLRDLSMQVHRAHVPAKSSSAEAEVPVLPPKQFKGVMDTHSTSSGTSDMSDYIETLSLTSSHSSSETGVRLPRQPTSTLRPRSGKEYHNLDPILTSMYKSGKDLANYTNIP